LRKDTGRQADMIKRYPAVAGAAFLFRAIPRRESDIDKKKGEIIKKSTRKDNRKSDRLVKPHKQQKEVSK